MRRSEDRRAHRVFVPYAGPVGIPMPDPAADPLVLALLFVARCLFPVGALLGLSYLLRRLGLVQGPPDITEKPKHNSQASRHGRT